ncbi:alpha/beta fold hydrolase [Horticoccus sp. 23ND18S-11]|uniref:alpha/beta fold hydrolase n=1 Tax=Horticoccus sp. 23ND18S-11 TaxID=3391832 RepID=UPI0039C9E95F
MKRVRLVLCLAAGFTASWLRAAPPPELPIETFFKKANIASLTFSPDGKRIACLVPYERRMNLAVIDLEKKTKNLLTNFRDNDVGSLLWASNDRLVYTKDFDGEEWAAVYAVNRDGSEAVVLASGAQQAGTTQQANNQFRGLLTRLPDDPQHILVLGNLSGAQGPDVCRMNLKTGRMTLDTPNPGWVRRWVLDRQRRPRVAVSQQGQTITVLLRDDAKGTWTPVHSHEADRGGWSPLGFDGDNRTLFVSSSVGRRTTAVYRYDTDTRALGELVYGDNTYDSGGVVWDEPRQKVVAVSCNADRPRLHWIDAEAEALQRRIDASLPDTTNRLLHASRDGSRRLILSTSDRDPGVYYLFDQATKKIEELAVIKPGIDPEKMASMRPISFRARDGLTIHGYLTVPAGREAKGLPLVLHPHGGPYGIRDSWGFNPEIQFYANRGYAVLQVNYRGSGGYGAQFERAGWKKWGLEMQHDLTDAVRWAIAGGIADPQRVVIAGASYGGYATMAGLAFTPELYCAGINYVGVVDIEELIPTGESATASRLHWMSTRIADLSKAEERKRLHDTSPVHFADRIVAPVLMAYGKNDPRVRISQGFDMEAALKKAGRTYEMIIEKEEGHGFRKEEISIAFYTRVDAFLKKYVPPAGAAVKIGPTKVVEPAR